MVLKFSHKAPRADFPLETAFFCDKGRAFWARPFFDVTANRLLQVLVDETRHLEHRDLLRSENRAKVIVCVDHAAILGILEALPLDVSPKLLGDFGAGHRATSDDR